MIRKPHNRNKEQCNIAGGEQSAAGAEMERAAEQWLRRQGLVCVARNFRCKVGEIDLVMRHGNTLVFVEVRLRRNCDFGGAAASVTRAKQQRLINAAQWYLQRNPRWRDWPCRFDVVAADTDDWLWIRDAFCADH